MLLGLLTLLHPGCAAACPQVAYDALISTVPLDITLRWLGQAEWADGLQHSSSHIIGFGEGCPRLRAAAVDRIGAVCPGGFLLVRRTCAAQATWPAR